MDEALPPDQAETEAVSPFALPDAHNFFSDNMSDATDSSAAESPLAPPRQYAPLTFVSVLIFLALAAGAAAALIIER